jgi:hypothetical protein
LACTRRKLVYDFQERRVWCQDCEQAVEPFDAFVILVEHFAAAERSLTQRRVAIAEAEAERLVLLAARQIDQEWHAGMPELRRRAVPGRFQARHSDARPRIRRSAAPSAFEKKGT